MTCGICIIGRGAYCDHSVMVPTKIVAPPAVANAAYPRIRRLNLGIDEGPYKGPAVWEGEGIPSQAQPEQDMFPPAMPGVASRITHVRHLGVFVGGARPGPARAAGDPQPAWPSPMRR